MANALNNERYEEERHGRYNTSNQTLNFHSIEYDRIDENTENKEINVNEESSFKPFLYILTVYLLSNSP